MAFGRSFRLGVSARHLLLELVIVFVGVYGAFWVDNFRDQRAQEESARLLAAALRQDLLDSEDVARQFVKSIDTGIAQWEEARSRGETPPPFIFRIEGSELPPTATWEAVRQADAATLFDPGLLFDLGFFYNEMTGMAKRYVRYAVFTEEEVLPRLKPGGAGFYDEEGKHLLPRFAAHMDRLREYRDFMAGTVDWSACLLERLEKPRQKSESCRSETRVLNP